ncbi:hypothetical protein OE88DRAFT_1651151 [Heliocybe sulcata]|uniref:Uncharacterized protein n=1 Tax=Heliocybe sulcata TaxID=5364 RepID=A0A5C3NKM8_9AGAM|nr:hypothetical protein OE88DRAFT_1651151 [Heliocybe sulcata]
MSAVGRSRLIGASDRRSLLRQVGETTLHLYRIDPLWTGFAVIYKRGHGMSRKSRKQQDIPLPPSLRSQHLAMAPHFEFASPNVSTSSLADMTQNILKACRHRVTRPQKRCTHCIKSDSGPARTQPTLHDRSATRHGRLVHLDSYLCSGAVDIAKLLHLSRRDMLSTARDCGGNVLLDEEWSYEISHPTFRRHNRYKVTIHYSATVGRSCWPDTQKPVQLANAHGIAGLMTILDRSD